MDESIKTDVNSTQIATTLPVAVQPAGEPVPANDARDLTGQAPPQTFESPGAPAVIANPNAVDFGDSKLKVALPQSGGTFIRNAATGEVTELTSNDVRPTDTKQ